MTPQIQATPDSHVSLSGHTAAICHPIKDLHLLCAAVVVDSRQDVTLSTLALLPVKMIKSCCVQPATLTDLLHLALPQVLGQAACIHVMTAHSVVVTTHHMPAVCDAQLDLSTPAWLFTR